MSYLTSAVLGMREGKCSGLLYVYRKINNSEFIIAFNKILIIYKIDQLLALFIIFFNLYHI